MHRKWGSKVVRIITDSAADFEPHELKEKDINCVSMTIVFGDKEYHENVNLTKSEFYELLETSEAFPKTSQPSPFEFETLLNKFKAAGDECIIITVSSGLSGTHQNAVMTKKMTGFENCCVVDTLNVACGQRILVEEAVKLRDEGKSAKEIAAVLETLKGKVKITACADTLEYLYKGGRLSKKAYAVGSAVNIKPIIRASAKGEAELCGKTLSMKKGIRTMCDSLLKNKVNSAYPIYVLYSHNRKNADNLVKSLKELGYDIPDERMINLGATIGAHIGKNACGFAYVAEE